jgi:flagellar hook protein FlgE
MNYTKSCTICQIEFPATTDFFHKCSVRSKYGIKSYCKKCGNKKALERYYKNREHNLLKQKEWHYSNREKRTKQLREYSYSHRDNRNKYLAKKMKQDGQFKIRKNIRDRMRSAMQGKSKSKNTMELLGCTIEELKTHLEKQFTHGMNWDNYGKKGWHIDHILPCASFDLTDPEQQRKCFHYTNLQPLWATDNYKKKDKIV